MNILVLNGSPKGKNSVTLQTALYLEKLNPEHTFRIIHAAQSIRTYEKDFSFALEDLKWAELILFVCPVYSLLVPSQLHRFIVLMKQADIDYSKKYASIITTSKHFYDVTAHQFILENCLDMKLKYIKGLSADMEDLLKEKGQKDARNFFDYLMWAIEHDLYETIQIKSTKPKHKKISVPEKENVHSDDKKIVIVADLAKEDKQLASMIECFQKTIGYKTELVNLHAYPFLNGCINCFECTTTGKCIITDGFDDLLKNTIQAGNAVVLAFRIQDHSMGSVIKIYDDRQFVNGHRAVTMGTPIGYIVSGNLSEEPNVRTLIDARTEIGANFMAGIVSDEFNPDAEMKKMVDTLTYALEKGYAQPGNFYGVGGAKIFRDMIYQMRGLMKLDYRFYKEHGQLDYPQNKPKEILKGYLAGMVLSNPKIKAKLGMSMDQMIVDSYRKVVETNPEKAK